MRRLLTLSQYYMENEKRNKDCCQQGFIPSDIASSMYFAEQFNSYLHYFLSDLNIYSNRELNYLRIHHRFEKNKLIQRMNFS